MSGTATLELFDYTAVATVYTFTTTSATFDEQSYTVSLTSGHVYELIISLSGATSSNDKALISSARLSLAY